ncbi:pyridoxamine kinase [Qiania dongpingensis]|uniref:pyridoxal kinase n=1 Tax=Qiania dongpingensis TaxID=2763669 RepID=A0A7G9G5T5_9FIRM|nr:pyridoxamine kinase [Qiania dongpingensis]QNM06167.1 pyridoxamine kinase [Qiania dongpingensis]
MESKHNNQKKIAVINDMSGFGRCSIAVAMPIISVMKIQCCPVPTSIFSNHTGFPEYFFEDYTEKMPEYIANWKKLGLEFEGISSGFLGSKAQIDIVRKFIRDFRTERTTVIIDPVMGDYGKPYPTYTDEMCQEMKRLVEYADILTPNLTEACILTDTPYSDGRWSIKDIVSIAEKIKEKGPEKIVITGIRQGDFVANLVYEDGNEPRILRSHRVGTERSGTGDVFAAVIAADAVNGVPFPVSVKKASDFVKKCILRSEEMKIPRTDGVCFEELLNKLK